MPHPLSFKNTGISILIVSVSFILSDMTPLFLEFLLVVEFETIFSSSMVSLSIISLWWFLLRIGDGVASMKLIFGIGIFCFLDGTGDNLDENSSDCWWWCGMAGGVRLGGGGIFPPFTASSSKTPSQNPDSFLSFLSLILFSLLPSASSWQFEYFW